jgi:hypothetical protein
LSFKVCENANAVRTNRTAFFVGSGLGERSVLGLAQLVRPFGDDLESAAAFHYPPVRPRPSCVGMNFGGVIGPR